MTRRKAGENKVTVRNITDVSGEVNIAGGDIYKGFTAEQVSLLLTQIISKYQRKPFDGRCPYKGLDVFEEEDAKLFFGRERLVDDLVNRVKESRTVFITGPSGSGKSSLVRAGLIHALKEGKIKGSERWLYETMKPGREPIKDLSLAFSRLKGPDLTDYFLAHVNETDVLNKCAESVLSGQKTQRFVLFIDQFEEVFTQINQEEERQVFINMLAHAGTVENGRMIVLFAMRSDFVSNCATYPALNELLSQEFRQIGAMQSDELVAAIALPAKQVGLPIEDELIARIINDMKGEPGALPLMQFALKELFEAGQAKGGATALTLKEYLEREGIQKMLARHADDTLNKLNENQQTLARSIFSGLIEIGRGTQDTKRTALFDELVPANASTADVFAIVQKLADARLIITDEQAGKDTVTISHEKLIEAWPWLKKLVDENRDAIAVQNEIANDAKEWEDHQREPSYLYTGARLANVHEQLEANRLVLSELAQVFVDSGIEVELAEQREEERRRQKELDDARKLAETETQRAEEQAYSAKKLRQRSIYLTGALVAALVAVGVAVFFNIQSQQQAKIARAGELAALAVSLRDKQLDLSLLLSVEVFRRNDTTQTRSALLDNTQANPRLIQYMHGHSDSVTSLAFSPDGKILASGGRDHVIILWDVASRQPIGEPLTGHNDFVTSVAFSPDGKIIASGGQDHIIILWDVTSHQPIGPPLTGHSGSVSTVAFSPDGKILASGSDDNTILWDVASRQHIGQPLTGHSGSVSSVAFSPDGKTLVSGNLDKTITLWDVASQQPIGQPLTEHGGSIESVAFSPDGKILASVDVGDTLFLWDVVTWRPIGQSINLRSDSVLGASGIAFSPDGKTLVSGSTDNTIILLDVASRQPIGEPLTGHSDFVGSIAFSPDGKTIASGSQHGTIILWDIARRQPIGQPLGGGSTTSVAFSPDGKTLASGSGNDGNTYLWDVASRQPSGQPLASGYVTSSVAFSPDGKILASENSDHVIILWDSASRQPIGQSMALGDNVTFGVSGIAFSPDGTILASGTTDHVIILWDVASRQPIGEPLTGHSDFVGSIAFSPDGRILASGSNDRTIILWDVASHQPIGQPLVSGYLPTTVAFSPDGKILASGTSDHIVILWNLVSRSPIGQPLTGHSANISSVAFSPDGRILASGSNDRTIILWDVASHQPIGQPLTGHRGPEISVVFGPDGKILASGSYDNSLMSYGNTLILWDLDAESWVEQSCRRAGRNLTGSEWDLYFPNEKYHATCTEGLLRTQSTQENNAAYYYAFFEGWLIILYGIYGWLGFRAILSGFKVEPLLTTTGFTWKRFLLAGSYGGLLFALTVVGLFTIIYGLSISLEIFPNSFIRSPYIRFLLLLSGSWTGGVYAYFTRFQSGKLSRTKRIVMGSFAGFFSIFVFCVLILLIVMMLSTQSIGSKDDWFTILITSVIVGGIGGVLSFFGALIYIFGIQKWTKKSINYEPASGME